MPVIKEENFYKKVNIETLNCWLYINPENDKICVRAECGNQTIEIYRTHIKVGQDEKLKKYLNNLYHARKFLYMLDEKERSNNNGMG